MARVTTPVTDLVHRTPPTWRYGGFLGRTLTPGPDARPLRTLSALGRLGPVSPPRGPSAGPGSGRQGGGTGQPDTSGRRRDTSRRRGGRRQGGRRGPSAGVTLFAVAATAGLLAGCSGSTTTSSAPATTAAVAASTATAIPVTAGDSTCQVGTTTLSAGRYTFDVTNAGSDITEMYIYSPGDRVMGEVENIAPGTMRTLITDLPAGSYQVSCRPGMIGFGIRRPLTVTGTPTAGAVAPSNAQLAAAVATYRAYVQAEANTLVDTTVAFTAAVRSGNLAQARLLYPPARTHYERIEPIAESFGDLDPLIDMRANDASPSRPFVGFHRLEQELLTSPTLTPAELGAARVTAAALVTNVRRLAALIPTVTISDVTMGNGAKELLDEVAKSKVTGEEERYSRIDLVDFEANVDGSRVAYTALRPVLEGKDPALVATLDERFSSLEALLYTHRAIPGHPGVIPGSPFVSYDALTPSQIKALAVEVDAISEPLGSLTGVLIGP